LAQRFGARLQDRRAGLAHNFVDAGRRCGAYVLDFVMVSGSHG